VESWATEGFLASPGGDSSPSVDLKLASMDLVGKTG